MLVWVLQTGEPLPVDPGNLRPMRAINLCNELVRAGHRVVLWSADFSHVEKKHRFNKNQTIEISPYLEVRLIKSRGYRKNIGVGRLLDHAQLAFNLHRLLKHERQSPDVAFVGYPPIEAAWVLLEWLKTRGVPAMLDIKDQWPEIFIEAIPPVLRPPARLAFWPYFYLARRSMRMASSISTMANGFLDWALRFAGRNRNEHDGIFPLTSPAGQSSVEDLRAAGKWWDERGVHADEGTRVCFVGSLSPAFDFVPIREAARMALQRGDEILFIICGDGNSAPEIHRLMNGLSNVIFPGWIDRPKIEALAARSSAALAPYVNSNNFTMNLPNKVIDALALGLPLLSPLSGEVKSLIIENEVGYHYAEHSGRGLYQCLQEIIYDPERRLRIAGNARNLYAARFSFERVYGELVDRLERLSRNT